MMHLLLLS